MVRGRGRKPLRRVRHRQIWTCPAVRPDDVRGLVLSGEVRGPPKRGASAAEIKTGVVMGEFAGYQV